MQCYFSDSIQSAYIEQYMDQISLVTEIDLALQKGEKRFLKRCRLKVAYYLQNVRKHYKKKYGSKASQYYWSHHNKPWLKKLLNALSKKC